MQYFIDASTPAPPIALKPAQQLASSNFMPQSALQK
nr:MAG TPA: hypothetical protein [Caudoviricetes sp.]